MEPTPLANDGSNLTISDQVYNFLLCMNFLNKIFSVYCETKDPIRTLVSMATDTSHRVIMGENGVIGVSQSTRFDQSLFIQVGNDAIHKRLNMFKFRYDRTMNYGVSCP